MNIDIKVFESTFRNTFNLFIRMLQDGRLLHKELLMLALQFKQNLPKLKEIEELERPAICSACNGKKFGLGFVDKGLGVFVPEYFCVDCSSSYIKNEWRAQDLLYTVFTDIDALDSHIKEINKLSRDAIVFTSETKGEA